mmetsp:Transcript_25557/g.29489  ORF Transcript_25557/g.29489 Transcript_25557/m.29489 type:complete len:250 (+) Transcript_25557:73-822(+)
MISPEDVLDLEEPTPGFLCSLMNESKYDFDFTSFKISDYDSKATIFEICEDGIPSEGAEMTVDTDDISFGEDNFRKIKYTFSEDVLRLPMIQTSLTFNVGKAPLPNMRMIERHYFRSKLIKSYDFSFGFCIPGSTNTWDAVYVLPPLNDALIDEMIQDPYETKSDTFYFINNELIMHNKASYKYTPEQQAQGKRSYNKSGFGESKSLLSGSIPCEEKDGFMAEEKTCGNGYRSYERTDAPWSKDAEYDD